MSFLAFTLQLEADSTNRDLGFRLPSELDYIAGALSLPRFAVPSLNDCFAALVRRAHRFVFFRGSGQLWYILEGRVGGGFLSTTC